MVVWWAAAARSWWCRRSGGGGGAGGGNIGKNTIVAIMVVRGNGQWSHKLHQPPVQNARKHDIRNNAVLVKTQLQRPVRHIDMLRTTNCGEDFYSVRPPPISLHHALCCPEVALYHFDRMEPLV